jgi:FkbM family methyltransferase
MKKYSIVIPTYNHCDDFLKPCIESILQYSKHDEIEICISANGCTDNTKEYLQEIEIEYPDIIKWAWSDEPLGYARSTNRGIKISTGEFVMLLNNDTVVLEHEHNKWLERLCEPFTEDIDIGITGIAPLHSSITNREFLIFFLVMMRRSLFDEIGLLDEEFIVGGAEDTEFCYRTELAGYKIKSVVSYSIPAEHANFMVCDYPLWHVGEGTAHDKNCVWINLEENADRNHELLFKKTRTPISVYKSKIVLKHTYPGLGDNLCHSTLPEIFSNMGYDVYISNEQGYRNNEIKQLIDMNPFIKGYTSRPVTHNIEEHLKGAYPIQHENKNYHARIELSLFGHAINNYPKIYYSPKYLYEWADITFIDFNSVTEETPRDEFLKYALANNTNCVQTNIDVKVSNIFEYIDIIFSSKKFICTYSGSMVLAAAINIRNVECYTTNSWLEEVIKGGGYCFHYDNVNYISYDKPENSIINVSDDIDFFEMLKSQNESTYKEIFEHNEYAIEEKDVKGKTVIDIGCNRGMFMIKCAQLEAKKIIGFEASETISLIADNNLTKYINRYGYIDYTIGKYAVSDISNQTVYIKSEDDIGGSIYHDTGEATTTISLNDIMNSEKDNIVVKCDCEGSEFEIFLSLSDENYKKIDCICMEIHSDANPNYINKFDLLYDKFIEQGFKRITHQEHHGWLWDGNGEIVPGSERYIACVEKWIKQPLIHIITPTYKRFDKLKETIESVKNQTHQNFIHHIIADGHDEDVYYYIKHLNDSRFKYSCTEHEGSIGGLLRMSALNALKSTSKEYVSFLDDDNIIYPEYIEKLLKNIEGEEDKYGISCCQIYMDKFDYDRFPEYPDVGEDFVKFECIDTLNYLVRLDLAKPHSNLWLHKFGGRITHDFDFINAISKTTKLKFLVEVLASHGRKGIKL